MPFVELKSSPHAPGISPLEIHYRDVGSGEPVVFLHGGWGYGVYPIDRQIEEFRNQVRFIIPDRSGHGRSSKFNGELPTDFHRRAAQETLLFLDKLGIDRAIIWGHSDGAVIAALIGLAAPARCRCLILEAFHFNREKAGSRQFFRHFAGYPEEAGEKLSALLAADHGIDEWKEIVRRNCRAWLRLADESSGALSNDLYHGRLIEMKARVVVMHGRSDPRTERGEMESALAALPAAQMSYVEAGRHSPHTEEMAWRECNTILSREFSKLSAARSG
jgi:pimeloyl-ACP methyl ester carboxylesterase